MKQGKLPRRWPPLPVSNPCSMAMVSGFIMVLFATSVAVTSGGFFGSLLSFTGFLAGVILIFVGVWMAENPAPPAGPKVLDGARALGAFMCRNLTVVGFAVASSVVTAVSGEAGPVPCFAMFALLLLGLYMINIGVIGE